MVFYRWQYIALFVYRIQQGIFECALVQRRDRWIFLRVILADSLDFSIQNNYISNQTKSPKFRIAVLASDKELRVKIKTLLN